MQIKLNEEKGTLVQVSEVCLHDGETLQVNVTLEPYSHFYAFINEVNLGKMSSGSFGIHSTKFKDGINELRLDVFTAGNMPKVLKTKIVKRPGLRNSGSIERELVRLYKEVDKLSSELADLQKWKVEIDNERSGF